MSKKATDKAEVASVDPTEGKIYELPKPLDEVFCIMGGTDGDLCPACEGTGQLEGKDGVMYMCMNCNGGGQVNLKRVLVIHTGIVHVVRNHTAPGESISTVSAVGLELPEDIEHMRDAKVFGNLPVRATWTTEGVMGDGIFPTMEDAVAKKTFLEEELAKAQEKAKKAVTQPAPEEDDEEDE
jgi:hypothetical protein